MLLVGEEHYTIRIDDIQYSYYQTLQIWNYNEIISIRYFIYNCILLVLRIVTWSYNCLLKIIIGRWSYLPNPSAQAGSDTRSIF